MSDEIENNISDLVDGFLAEQRESHAASQGNMSYRRSVQAFISASDWLGAEHMPSIVALLSLADKLDREVTAAMVSQFGVTFRDLRAQSPGGAPDKGDPLEDDLERAGK